MAPDGVEFKIDNKYVLLPRDDIINTIREGDKIKFVPSMYIILALFILLIAIKILFIVSYQESFNQNGNK